MFERFTERARQVVVLAQDEARALSHDYIGTEHILLGLVRENEGVAARILLDFDADAEKIRNEIIRMLSGPGRPFVGGPVIGTWPAAESLPRRVTSWKRRRFLPPTAMLVAGWLLFALALGAGILVGWAIWG